MTKVLFLGLSSVLGGRKVLEGREGKKHIFKHIWSCHMTSRRALGGFEYELLSQDSMSLQSVCAVKPVCVCVCGGREEVAQCSLISAMRYL